MVLDRLANALIIVGGALLAVAVVLLFVSYRPKKRAERGAREFGLGETISRFTWLTGWAFVVFLVPVGILGFFARSSTIGAVNAASAVVTGVAALSLLVSLSTPGLVLSHRPRDVAFWGIVASMAIGVVGITGQMALLFSPAFRMAT